MEHLTKAEPQSRPKHLQFAMEVSENLIGNFSGAEQHQFMVEVDAIITSHYKEKIANLESELKRQFNTIEEFKGNFPMKENKY